VAQQDINNLLTTGQYQQSSPYVNAANLGNILAGIQAPQTVSNTTQVSPINQVAGLASLLGGSTGSGGLVGQLFGTSGSGGGLLTSLANAFGLNSGSSSSSSSGLTADQIYSGANTGSNTYDSSGNLVSTGTME